MGKFSSSFIPKAMVNPLVVSRNTSSFFQPPAALSTPTRRVSPPALRHYCRHPTTNTTMSDWKAPMTKLVNQIYSKADAGKSFRACLLVG